MLTGSGGGDVKTQERNAASAHRGVAGAAPGGDRLPAAPRERKPALAALAALLVLLGALGTTLLVMRAGDREDAVAITKRVPQGQAVPQSAIKSVTVAKDSGVNYVPWDQRKTLTKYRASADLVPGSLLVGDALSEDKGLGGNKVVVGLSLKANQYPSSLRDGDTVAAYRSAGTSGSSSNKPSGSGASGEGAPIAEDVKVQSVGGGGDSQEFSGDRPVSVVVSKDQAQQLTSAASNDEVSLVITPSGSGS